MEFVLYLVLGACAGVLAGLFGVGGGLIIVPALVFSFTAHGFSPDVLTQMAVGTSLATIIFTSINSILEHHRRGAVRWRVFAWMTVGILVGSALGALTASKIRTVTSGSRESKSFAQSWKYLRPLPSSLSCTNQR